MKGTSLIVSVILFIAVAVLYVLHFTGSASSIPEVTERDVNSFEAGSLSIAYVKADSILVNYDLAQDLHDEFTKKQEAYTTEYGTKRQTFEKEAAEFQEKVQRGGFLTEQRAIQERDRLLGKEQEILKLDQELSTKLADLQNANNEQLLDSLLNCIEILNEKYKYAYILNSADILVGDEAHNLTSEVLSALNERYSGNK